MNEQWILVAGDWWQTLNGLQKTGVVFGALYACIAIVMGSFWALMKLDSKVTRRRKEIGRVRRKYLEIPHEAGCYEVMDTPEMRKKDVRFMVSIFCDGEVDFAEAVTETEYDHLHEDEVLIVTYDQCLLSRRARFVAMRKRIIRQ